MSLKDKILANQTKNSCSNCKHFEILRQEIPYCNSSDKMILYMHINVERKCENFELKEEK